MSNLNKATKAELVKMIEAMSGKQTELENALDNLKKKLEEAELKKEVAEDKVHQPNYARKISERATAAWGKFLLQKIGFKTTVQESWWKEWTLFVNHDNTWMAAVPKKGTAETKDFCKESIMTARTTGIRSNNYKDTGFWVAFK